MRMCVTFIMICAYAQIIKQIECEINITDVEIFPGGTYLDLYLLDYLDFRVRALFVILSPTCVFIFCYKY